MSRLLFIIGSIGLIACLYWWATYYNTFLDVMGLKNTTKEWTEAIQIYGQCLFWDTERCLSAWQEPKIAGHTPYRPHFIWLAFGVLLAGAVIRIREGWRAAGHDPAPRR
jgi:hypothetical protein